MVFESRGDVEDAQLPDASVATETISMALAVRFVTLGLRGGKETKKAV